MTEKEIGRMDEQEFDLLLEDIMDSPPPMELDYAFKPWRVAMNRILWGTGLTTLTLNFWNLDVIMPAIGMILLLLGYRALRKENKWFQMAYRIAWIRVIWWIVAFSVNVTIFSQEPEVRAFLAAGTYVMLIPGFFMLVALRNGIRCVQNKAGLPPHGGNGMLVWYLIILVLGLVSFSGYSVWGLIIAYLFILRNLYKLSAELDEAGYTVSPAPVKVSDRAVKLVYAGIIVLSMVIGYGFFNKYPMNWQPLQESTDAAAEEVRQELLELGFPEKVLNDMTPEEILSCDGAVFVLAEERDYDMDQGRGIGTREEINGGLYALITEEEGERQLRTTYVGVKIGGEPERWKLIHHFEWLEDPDFCGTEAIQMWPYSQSGWDVSGDFTGRVLYDHNGTTWASDYHSLGKVTYDTDNFLSQMLGQTSSTDVFATFSMPGKGTRHRGYVMYELSERMDGCLVSSWFNYVHQHSRFQFPVQTAMEYEMTAFIHDGLTFRTIQTALQFGTHEEIPELLG